MHIRDRIVRFDRVAAGELLPNPRNWRTHPKAQQDALRGILAEVGWVDALLVRETPDGLQIVDGHLRAEVAPAEEVPVLVLDLSDAEADKVLATFDPLVAMAESDPAKLDALLREVETGSEALAAMLEGLAEDAGLLSGGKPTQDPDEPVEPPAEYVTQPGDMWVLGTHRLLCGDSTDSSQISLLGVSDPALQIFDPPFDSDYSRWPLIGQPKIVMVWQRGAGSLKWEAAVLTESYGCHELVFSGGPRGWPADWFPCTVHDTVRMWRSDKSRKSFDAVVLKNSGCRTVEDGTRPFSVQEHAGGVLTGYGGMSWGKALVAMELAMAYIDAGELVYDPCAGSGTSLVAAQKHGRRWLGMENQPQWCDLIAERFRKQCGGEPQRIAANDVASYNAGTAGGGTPASPKRTRAKKEHAHV